jgi:hypothetical protein
MGEAKRRRARERATEAERTAEAEARAAHWAWMERIASEDPDDRADREAHGFSYDDDWQDPAMVCRNGCGLPYREVVAGKIRTCLAARSGGDGERALTCENR